MVKTEPVWPDGATVGVSTKNKKEPLVFNKPEIPDEDMKLIEKSGKHSRSRRNHSKSPGRALTKTSFDNIKVEE